jgi:formate C-acetyltransferase
MMARLSADLSNIYASYTNRFGGNGKPVILSFVWAPVAGKLLGATPDGRHAGIPVAQAVTPQGMAMKNGITAAMNSCAALPFELFTGGATTMWDLDHTSVSVPLVRALLLTFFAQGGQFFQGNMTDVNDLIEAQRDPENHRSLVVRVGGYSARFIQLKTELQNEIINRYRHKS